MNTIVRRSVVNEMEEKIRTQKIKIGQFESNINDPKRSSDLKELDRDHQFKFKDRLILYEKMLAAIKT